MFQPMAYAHRGLSIIAWLRYIMALCLSLISFHFEKFIDSRAMRLHGDFVREIGSKHAALRTDPIDDVGQRLFVALAADEKSVAAEVLDAGFSQRRRGRNRVRRALYLICASTLPG